MPLSDSTLAANLPSGPLLQQPVVVGPGFLPIPAKTVSQIVAGKYVDLGDLLSVNIVPTEPESQAFLDGRLMFLPSAKKQRRRIKDIVTCSEAFAIFTLILTSYFSPTPERFNFLQASHPAHIPPVQWSCLAAIRSALPPARCGDEAHGLVDHECSTLQFSCCWDLCAFWVW